MSLPALAGAAYAGALTPSQRQIYALAFAAADDGKTEAAREIAAAGGQPQLDKVLLWMDLKRQRPTGDFAAIAAFLTQNPTWPSQGTLRRAAEIAMPETLPQAEVLRWFADYPPLSATGALRYGEALTAAQRTDEAAALVRGMWPQLDLSSAEERAFYLRFGHLLTAADHLARLERLIDDRKRSAALRLAKGLGEDHYALTLARLKLKLMEPGVDAAIARVPAHLRSSPELLFERAHWRQRKNRFADALVLIEAPGAAAIDPARWWPLRNRAAREALRRGEPELAYRLASQHRVGQGLGFAEGEFLAGWIALRWLDRADQAKPHFRRLHDGVTSPISRARGAFWAGEAARRLQQVDEAATWYRQAATHDLTFYGQLAARRLGEEAQARQVSPPLAGLLPEGFAADELVRTTELLHELGHDKLVGRMFAALRFRAATAEELWPIADFALTLGRPDQAVRTAKIERRMGGDPQIAHLYPRPPLALAENDRTALVLALIRQESQFDAKAISPAGARGLMQLMPATAKQVAKEQKLGYGRARLTEDPAYNVKLGQVYLAAMLERYDGYAPLALAAYNAGPHRVDRWLGIFGDPRTPDVDALDWIESIPFDETRNYVQRVMEGYAVYARMQATTIDPLAAVLAPPQTVWRVPPGGETDRPN